MFVNACAVLASKYGCIGVIGCNERPVVERSASKPVDSTTDHVREGASLCVGGSVAVVVSVVLVGVA